MNGMLRLGASLAVLAWILAWGGGLALGQVQVFMNGQMQVVGVDAGIAPPGGETSTAIGDPWWDEAEGTPPAAAPADAADEDGPAADPRVGIEFRRRMMRRSLEQQGLTTLRRELSVVREACPTLEPHERAAVLQAGRGVIEKIAENREASAAFHRRRHRGEEPDLGNRISAALRASLASTVGATGAAAYERECGLRRERAKQATIAALVAEVDRDADLEPPEREALAKVLAEEYRERWRQSVTQAGLGSATDLDLQGFDRCVEQALGKERKAEWLARRNARAVAADGGGQGIQIIGNAGWVDVPVQVPDVAPGPVLRRRIINNGNGLQLQIEVQAGGGGAEAEDEAAADQQP